MISYRVLTNCKDDDSSRAYYDDVTRVSQGIPGTAFLGVSRRVHSARRTSPSHMATYNLRNGSRLANRTIFGGF